MFLETLLEAKFSKLKFKGTVCTLPGRGRKRKLSTDATRFLRMQIQKIPRVTAKDLLQDLMARGTEVSACIERRILGLGDMAKKNYHNIFFFYISQYR